MQCGLKKWTISNKSATPVSEDFRKQWSLQPNQLQTSLKISLFFGPTCRRVCNTVAVVEVAVLGSKRRKLSDITEMDLVAGAVHGVVTNFTYV